MSYIAYYLLIFTAICWLISKRAYKSSLFISLAALYIFMVAFHCIYDLPEVYVFSANYTFPLVAILALPFKLINKLKIRVQAVCYAILTLSVILLMLNNYFFVRELLSIF